MLWEQDLDLNIWIKLQILHSKIFSDYRLNFSAIPFQRKYAYFFIIKFLILY